MLEPTITFVTAFIDLNEDIIQNRTPEIRLKYFKHLAESGIAICLYVSSVYETIGRELENEYKNVKLMPFINIEELETYKLIKLLNPELPNNRTECHDTLNFLILMNSKTEFVYNATLINPFNTEHFAWIDFNIFHIITDIENIKNKLYLFGYSHLKQNFLVAPGCWSKEHSKQIINNNNDNNNNNTNNITSKIHWRFCGGFIIGDKKSIQHMHLLMTKELPNFIKHSGKNIIAWEVNVWAWIEHNYDWNIDYYIAGHDNTMLYIPPEYISVVASLTSIPTRIKDCKLVIDSIINQVDCVYLNLCHEYIRFKNFTNIDIRNNIPHYFITEEPYKSKLKITFSNDYGPATKYLGALSIISKSQWMFICDDDQEYKPNLIKNMLNNISNINKLGVYQNRYNIVKNGSGGIIHGYVGNLIHSSLLENLKEFDLPDFAKYVDDQWLSIYCFLQNINVYPSGIEDYKDIFSILENGFEKIGCDSLASLHNRDSKIKELEHYYNIKFINNGHIIKKMNDIDDSDDIDSKINTNDTTLHKSILHKYIDKVIYINVATQISKKEEIENELNSFNIEYERFDAIQIPEDGIGCTQSHLEVIKIAKEKSYKNILILEDDFTFVVSKEVFEEQIDLLFNSKNTSGEPFNFDVCLLSYNLIKSEPCKEYTFLKKVLDVQTTSGYIINETMYDIFIDLYTWTLPLLTNTRKHWIYTIDQIWKILQTIKQWYCFDIRIGKQRPFYINSDNGPKLFVPDY
jgi:glycosyl transferase family 25